MLQNRLPSLEPTNNAHVYLHSKFKRETDERNRDSVGKCDRYHLDLLEFFPPFFPTSAVMLDWFL